MPVASIQSSSRVQPADVPVEKIAADKNLSEQEKTTEMTRQFEAMLLRQILTEAHKPVFKSKFAMSGVTASIYQDMTVNQLADKISSARTLGLAQELEKQFTQQNGDKKTPPAADLPKTTTAAAAPPMHLTKAPR